MDKKKYLSEDESKAMLRAARSKLRSKNPKERRDGLLVATLLNTGTRISECRQIKVEDIRFGKAPHIHLPAEITKGKKHPRTVPISRAFSRQIYCYLKKRNDDRPWLFPGSNGNALSTVSCWHIFKSMLWFAGVDESYSPHSTRHAVGFILYGKTKDVRLVQEFLGHTSLTSTQIYTAVDPKAMVAAAEGLW